MKACNQQEILRSTLVSAALSEKASGIMTAHQDEGSSVSIESPVWAAGSEKRFNSFQNFPAMLFHGVQVWPEQLSQIAA